MNKDKIYISTTASDAAEVARRWGLGLEIAEYCTAWNMDDEFVVTDVLVRKKLEGISRRVLHAPFNELFPCAIDRKARLLASERYRKAIELAKHYGAEKFIIYGGYNGCIIRNGILSRACCDTGGTENYTLFATADRCWTYRMDLPPSGQ